MNSNRKIKGFGDFMNGRRQHRSLDITIIAGSIKGGFFAKEKPFEIYIYHTHSKRIVIDCKVDGATLKDLGISIKAGDSVDHFRSWATGKGYKVEEFVR